MRAARDRLRQAISFEIIGLLLTTPLGALAFATPMHDMGVVAIVGATLATCWNYVFNLGFDHVLLRMRGGVRKSLALRVLHAALFEIGLLTMLLPFIAWYLDMPLVDALLMDAAFALFYLVYAFVFTWAYDRLFPPEGPARTVAARAD